MADEKKESKTPGKPGEGEAPTTAQLEQEIRNDPNLPAGLFARVMSDPKFREELVDKKRKGEALYENGEGEGEAAAGAEVDSEGEAAKVAKDAKDAKAKGEGEGDGDGEGEGEGEKKKKKRRSGYLRQAERAYEERDTLKRENEDLRRQLATKGKAPPFGEKKESKAEVKKKPSESDFESYSDFMEALSDWKVDERLSAEMAKRDKVTLDQTARNQGEQAVRHLDQALMDQTAAAKEKHADWQEVVEVVDEHMKEGGIEWSDAHMYSFAKTGRAGEIAYHLGQNPEESESLIKVQDRDSFMLELGKILTRVDSAAASNGKQGEGEDEDGEPADKVKKTPAPMKKHLGGTATAKIKDERYYADDASPKEYAEYELKRKGVMR